MRDVQSVLYYFVAVSLIGAVVCIYDKLDKKIA